MREWSEIHREGTDVGPVDWGHEMATALPKRLRTKLREAEKSSDGWRYSPSGFSSFPVIRVCMYDGWPYWRPTPSFCYVGPLGCAEWAHFDSYGVSENSIFRCGDAADNQPTDS